MRVTIDIDSHAEWLKAISTFYTLRHIFGNAEIRRTKRGYHIRSYTHLSTEQVNELRKQLGDDDTRIWIDETATHKPRQVLFTSSAQTRWSKDPWVVL